MAKAWLDAEKTGCWKTLKIRLRTPAGRINRVPVGNLSEAERNYVRALAREAERPRDASAPP